MGSKGPYKKNIMMIEFKKKVFIFKVEGKEYEVRKPNVRQVDAFQKKNKSADEESALDLTIDFLAELGMPKDVSYDMEVEHLQSIVEYVTGQKKS